MDFGQKMDEDGSRSRQSETKDESVEEKVGPVDRSTEQILKAAARGQIPESPEVDIKPIDRPKNAGPLYFTRKWYGGKLREITDLSNLVGFNDKSNKEVIDYVAEKRPDFIQRGVIDPENLRESLKNVDIYFQRRVQQRQRETAHGTYFPELRNHLVATTGKEAMEASDEKLVKMYADKHYDNQGPTDVADVIDDMIADGQKRQEKMLKESDNVRRASNLQELIDLTSKLDQQHGHGKKESYNLDMVVVYTDPDTGADLTFTSPMQAKQYRHAVQWRSLDFRDPTISAEFASASGRTVVDAAAFLTGLSAYSLSVLEKSGVAPSDLTDTIENLQKDLDAIRSSSFLREGDNLSELKLYSRDDDWYAPSGGAVETPGWWASSVGEVASLLGPVSGAVVAETVVTQKM